ncbi:MAG: DsrE family protein [Deltaproteobacteria bacterium]|nr:DsrE family protein [Deltaproteobacteria bacterium]
MKKKDHLYILWTNADLITAEKMVFMYGINARLKKWWEKVTLIIWGATTKLSAENPEIQKKIKAAMDAGVHVTACKACADQLGATEALLKMNVEVIYWGEPLTDILKDDEALLTI